MLRQTFLLTALFTGVVAASPIPMKSAAPEFIKGDWLNAAADAPLTLEGRRGKVTVLHYWTYGCYNCKNNLAAYNNWHKQFKDRDVAVIGVHTPEFDGEKIRSNVEKNVRKFAIEYPVLIDNEMANWRRWNQQFWPTVYLIDKRGKVRYRWEGELNHGNAGGEQSMARLIERLLAE